MQIRSDPIPFTEQDRLRSELRALSPGQSLFIQCKRPDIRAQKIRNTCKWLRSHDGLHFTVRLVTAPGLPLRPGVMGQQPIGVQIWRLGARKEAAPSEENTPTFQS